MKSADFDRRPLARRMIRFALDALAAYRLTKLVTSDVLTSEVRDGVVLAAYSRAGRVLAIDSVQRYPGQCADAVANDADPPKLAVLVTCPWCASFWLGLAVVALRRLFPRLWGPLAEALAFSAVAGLVAENLQHD